MTAAVATKTQAVHGDIVAGPDKQSFKDLTFDHRSIKVTIKNPALSDEPFDIELRVTKLTRSECRQHVWTIKALVTSIPATHQDRLSTFVTVTGYYDLKNEIGYLRPPADV